MRRFPNSSTVMRQRMRVDGDALRPSFATALGGVVQPNQTLAARSPAKLKASLSSSLGDTCRDSIGTWSHFRPHQIPRNQATEVKVSLLVYAWSCHSPQRFRTQGCITRHGFGLRCKARSLVAAPPSGATEPKRRTLHRFLSKLLQRPRPTERHPSTNKAVDWCDTSIQHSAFCPPFSCAEVKSPWSGLSMKRKRKPHPGG